MSTILPIQSSVFIGLGSNLQQPAQQLNSARKDINLIDSVSELKFSSLYLSPPMGPQDQPDYVNAVMSISTELQPLQILRALQAIELQHGRTRTGKRWTARTLDLDLLVIDDLSLNLPELIVPHIGIHERAFVLYPLYEIAPDLIIPGHGAVSELIKTCPLNGLIKM